MVWIPSFISGASPANEPLARCVRDAAKHSGMGKHRCAYLLAWFFQRITDRVAAGKVVRIFGFGAFGVMVCGKEEHRQVVPVFVASGAFRRVVAALISVEQGEGLEGWRRTAQHNASWAGRHKSEVPAVSMEKMRRHILRQAKSEGAEWADDSDE